MEFRRGARILLAGGPSLVEAVGGSDITVRMPDGTVAAVSHADVMADLGSDAVSRSLEPTWSRLPQAERDRVMERLAVVLEITTGYRSGFPDAAEPGEPRLGFGSDAVTLTQRCREMAQLRATSPQAPGQSTIAGWVKRYEQDGVLGLVDKRTIPPRPAPRLDPDFEAILRLELATLDGDRSTVNIKEVLRRADVAWKRQEGSAAYGSRKAARAIVTEHFRRGGSTTRGQRSARLRGSSGKRHYSALRPGQVIAIDVTRSDVMVRDAVTGEARPVEFITAIDVATRVVVAFRVVPKSADATDIALVLYDAMRPMSLHVTGRLVSALRWAGLPEAVTLSDPDALPRLESGMVRPPTGTLDGEHPMPGVMPAGLRADHGSVFTSVAIREVLRRFGIDLMLSRGSRPTDNPHVERWHETLQRAVQQLPGYKGRNPTQRGRLVESEDLLTPEQLRDHMHRFICLDYHQTPHDGLAAPGYAGLRITPLEMFDALMEQTGRVDLPADPHLLYDLLPVRWGTIRHAGVEFTNLTYDAAALDDYRALSPGAFRAKDAAAPFYYDPHDVSRVWFRTPDTGRVMEIPWRGADLLQAPLTARTVQQIMRRLRNRGGNKALSPDGAADRILEQLDELTTAPDATTRPRLFADRMRFEASREAHAEAAAEAARAPDAQPSRTPDWSADLLRPWPDYRE